MRRRTHRELVSNRPEEEHHSCGPARRDVVDGRYPAYDEEHGAHPDGTPEVERAALLSTVLYKYQLPHRK